jgi:uncharacterized membrane protein
MKLIKQVLTNKYALYAVALLSIVNVLGLLSTHYYWGSAVFIFIGLAMTLITKNMTIILLVPLILTNLLIGGHVIKEGMEQEQEKEKQEEKKPEEKGKKDAEPFEPTKDRRVDMGTTMSDAYEHLENMLDSDAMQKLSADTGKLIDQQSKLAKNMEGMHGLMSQAKEMMSFLKSGTGV